MIVSDGLHRPSSKKGLLYLPHSPFLLWQHSTSPGIDWNSIPRYGMCCLQNPGHYVFFVAEDGRYSNLSFTLEGKFGIPLTIRPLKNHWNCRSLTHHRVYRPSSAAHLFYQGPQPTSYCLLILSLIEWIRVTFCGRSRWPDLFRLYHDKGQENWHNPETLYWWILIVIGPMWMQNGKECIGQIIDHISCTCGLISLLQH